MRLNVFQIVKENVTARQAAEMYGLKVNRGELARCPFHNDKTPSMKVDERYYCFGCRETGDAVDLTAKLLGLGKRDAALQIAKDFALIVGDKPDRKRSSRPPLPKLTDDPQKEAEGWIGKAIRILIDYHWLLKEWEERFAPQSMDDEDWHPLFCEALNQKDRVDYLLDELMTCSKTEFIDMRKFYAKEVERIEKRLREALSARENETCRGADGQCRGGSERE